MINRMSAFEHRANVVGQEFTEGADVFSDDPSSDADLPELGCGIGPLGASGRIPDVAAREVVHLLCGRTAPVCGRHPAKPSAGIYSERYFQDRRSEGLRPGARNRLWQS